MDASLSLVVAFLEQSSKHRQEDQATYDVVKLDRKDIYLVFISKRPLVIIIAIREY